MAKILIVYATDYGATKKMAEEIAAGAASVEGCVSDVKSAEETTAEDMEASDAVIFGTPVHMGSPAWKIKKFIDTVCGGLWMGDKMNGKVGGVFATGGGFGGSGGGGELTMLAMINNLAEMGMVFVPFPKNTPGYAYGGLQWGPCARTADGMEQLGFPDNMKEPSYSHGVHIARAAKIISGQQIFE